MNIVYSSLLSSAVIAALQSRERYVRTALGALPAEGAFRWTTWPLPDNSDCFVLRHTCDNDRCMVWFSQNEIQRKFTEDFITTLICGKKRTTPGIEETGTPCA